MMKWKGRLSFKQFIPSKRHRSGIKQFVLCDVLTGYVQDIIVYTGKSTDITMVTDLGMSGSVVTTLMQPFLGKGHVLHLDNWYSSPTLFHYLLKNQTGACGTVRANRKGMSKFIDKMSKGDLEHFNNGEMLATKWRVTSMFCPLCVHGSDGESGLCHRQTSLQTLLCAGL